ncbi:hypothetical protein SBOR_3619 [Sclerotinia borealis F-4128]|uniref:Uncharacterized protein n=1 Tax=Sclerotinia borealis (strain F-4128) TaxID=1432307 RepID=W9CMW8_SCLBF|nr:hypothetical protein SBOR_3619 [Sclerotinia borealis F-4128]
MNQLIFDRSTGNLDPNAFARIQTTQLIHAISPAPKLQFNGGETPPTIAADAEARDYEPAKLWAHQTGVNALSIDRFEGKILLSGGADASIKVWDLDQIPTGASKYTFRPTGIVPRDSPTICRLRPKLHRLFPCRISHCTASPGGLRDPAVRLVDLRSGASTHSLAGHHGALLSVAWHPNVDHILASECVDGTIRLWDIRKSSGAVGSLDLEDAIGITVTNGYGCKYPCELWANTEEWASLKFAYCSITHSIDASHERTLTFSQRNRNPSFQLHEGRLLKRLKVPGPNVAAVRSRTGERNIKNRITALAWREPADGIYSAHTDGQIRAWRPRTEEDAELDREEEREIADTDDSEGGKRKRNVLDDVFRDLTRQKISFG